MLPFQAEPCGRCQRSPGGFFRSHITAIEPVRISRADDIHPYGGDRANGFLQRSYGKLFSQSYPHNRGLRKICRSKAWGSVNEGAHFVCVTEFTGSHNAAPADFSAVISAQSRTEKNLSEQGAGFRARGRVLCVRNRANGFLQRSYGKLFPQSDHSINDMAMALILTV